MRKALVAGGLAAVSLAVVALAWTAQAQAPERQMATLVNPPSNKNPFTGKPEAIEEGRTTFNTTCTTCHGVNGGSGEFAPGLAIPGRNYARRSDEQIFDAIKNGIQGTAMPAHAGRLNDDQIWKITAFIYGLRGTAIDAPRPGDVKAGEAVFWGKGECGTCHMVNGRGSVIGPDLTTIANLRKVNIIVDALTKENNKDYPPGGYQTYQLTPLQSYPQIQVVTNAGRTIKGVLRNEDSFSLQVMGLDQKMYLLKRANLKSVTYPPGRLMPHDYDKRLTKAEFDNLLAYVTRLGTPRSQTAAAARPAASPD